MTQNFLYFKQINARLDQVRRVTMAQAVWGDFFLIPQVSITLRKAACTPAGSSGVVARYASFNPPDRLGNNNTGLRWTFQ
jgi:hypothetical protein